MRKGLAVLLREIYDTVHIIEAKNVAELLESNADFGFALFIIVINSDFEEDGTSPVFEVKTLDQIAPIILYGEEIKP